MEFAALIFGLAWIAIGYAKAVRDIRRATRAQLQLLSIHGPAALVLMVAVTTAIWPLVGELA